MACKIGAMSSPDLSSGLPPAEPGSVEAGPAALTAEEIRACLKVLNTIHAYDEEHPDYVSVRRATGKMRKVRNSTNATWIARRCSGRTMAYAVYR